ncbi:MAG: GAF domain-containing protein [Acidobacteria bacterium]|nr:GAF domain-containing protein [Acidobacteriota bacterium]
MRLTVSVPPEHRSSLEACLRGDLAGHIEWLASGDADVVLGGPGRGRLAGCASWPGAEAAAALVAAGWERRLDQQDMERLNQVGRALASEQNLDRLLDLILTSARELLEAEAGSLYLVDEKAGVRELVFAHTQNAKVSLPYHQFRMPITKGTLAGFVAVTGESLNLEDVYRLPEDAPYHFSDAFDRQARYRTVSMLVVPMKDAQGGTLGVLQLINRVMRTPEGEAVLPFLASHQAMAESLAGQAGIAVKNAQLLAEIEVLFEGFVNASVTAIESRDPVTSGHSGRVADLTVGLAEAVNRTPNGVYGTLNFSPHQMREIRYASLLHDFGKVGVREQVLVKAKKLEPEKLEIVLQRLRQRSLEEALALLAESWKGGAVFDPAAWEGRIRDREAEAERLIALIRQSNEPTVLDQGVAEGLGLVADLDFTHWSGAKQPVLEPDDLAVLRIRRGSLSESERLEIESHVTHTFRFLKQIPWTGDLKGVPEIAYAHHERLTGTGYPRKLAAEAIPVQSRAMAISDVFDALTARDRPYKGAVPLEKSLDILGEEAKHGHLDQPLLDLFVEAKVFERTVGR